MRTRQIAAGLAILAGSSLAGAAAYEWEGAGFYYSPVPRWVYDPNRDLDFAEKVCPEIRRDAPVSTRATSASTSPTTSSITPTAGLRGCA